MRDGRSVVVCVSGVGVHILLSSVLSYFLLLLAAYCTKRKAFCMFAFSCFSACELGWRNLTLDAYTFFHTILVSLLGGDY